MPYQPPPEIAGLSLSEIALAVEDRQLPPLEDWQPAQTADSHMKVAADGKWFHEGSAITRPAMVRAFSSLLMQDNHGQHWLMTPECRQSIEVVDAAFVAVDVQAVDGALVFRLNTDELVIAGPENPLRAAGNPDVPAIYLSVRHGCEARLDRSTWLQLADLALASGDDLAVQSLGATFALVPA